MDNVVFGLKGQKLYGLKGSSIYKLNGDLVGHSPDARGEKKRLDKAADKPFPKIRRGLPICDDCQALTGGLRARAGVVS